MLYVGKRTLCHMWYKGILPNVCKGQYTICGKKHYAVFGKMALCHMLGNDIMPYALFGKRAICHMWERGNMPYVGIGQYAICGECM